MTKLPNQLRTLDSAYGLAIVEPLHHSPGVSGRAVQRRIRGARVGLDPKVAVPFGLRWSRDCAGRVGVWYCAGNRSRWLGDYAVIGFVEADMARFDESGLDVENVDLVEHRFDEALYGVLCCAVRTQAGHTKRTSRRGEDEVPSIVLGTEMRE